MILSARAVRLILGFSLAFSSPVIAQTVPAGPARSLAPAGGAAATLPNSFDIPAPTAPPTARVAPSSTDVAVAEATLRVVIEQLRAGTLDPKLYTRDLATRLTGQLPTIRPLLEGYGAIQSVEAQGTRDGAGQFLVIFDEAATQWRIGLNDEGLIAALLFRPAPPVSSDPTTPGLAD
ncbi:hypothetical protein HZ989_01880 [Brevundimonas sp. AJA228-03]|uniref:hypothetical protein n=1 Tax=Brevundimonas sp. AJA228-03 TaxID=2752515 RepID=UPI001ADF6C0D|nr:hypothetical protein [Brevundimonas sp. AJA228-03]QTN19853.1 hypothetical protein HZ989_01880 [Brevundimonas sp. AJA228-03]